jgi:hypothetical protein
VARSARFADSHRITPSRAPDTFGNPVLARDDSPHVSCALTRDRRRSRA